MSAPTEESKTPEASEPSPPRVTPHTEEPAPASQKAAPKEQTSPSLTTSSPTRSLPPTPEGFDVDKFFEEGVGVPREMTSEEFASGTLERPRAMHRMPPCVVHKVFFPTADYGYMYTVGLHAKGHPEFYACG